MAKPLKIIESLLHYLPERDIPHAERYLATKDFDGLMEIVDSAATKVENERVRLLHDESFTPKYATINYEKLIELRAQIDSYCSLIELACDAASGSDDYYD